MKRRLTLSEFNGHRLELFFLLSCQNTLNRIHVIGQAGDRQQVPTMAAGNVMNAAVFARGIVEANPAGEMGHRLGAGPVRIILMPRHYAAMMGRLVENLIVPKAHRPVQKLRRRHQEGRVPQQVVKRCGHAPRTQRMKENLARVSRFV